MAASGLEVVVGLGGAAAAGLGGLAIRGLYRIVRKRFPYIVNCHFCCQDVKVTSEERNRFVCPHCSQYNGWDASGDYNQPLPTPKQMRYVESQRPSSPASNGLCRDCNLNQELKVAQLAASTSEGEELEEYSLHLERAYRLCSRCEATLAQTLQLQDNILTPPLIGWRLEQSRLRLGAKQPYQGFWRHTLRAVVGSAQVVTGLVFLLVVGNLWGLVDKLADSHPSLLCLCPLAEWLESSLPTSPLLLPVLLLLLLVLLKHIQCSLKTVRHGSPQSRARAGAGRDRDTLSASLMSLSGGWSHSWLDSNQSEAGIGSPAPSNQGTPSGASKAGAVPRAVSPRPPVSEAPPPPPATSRPMTRLFAASSPSGSGSGGSAGSAPPPGAPSLGSVPPLQPLKSKDEVTINHEFALEAESECDLSVLSLGEEAGGTAGSPPASSSPFPPHREYSASPPSLSLFSPVARPVIRPSRLPHSWVAGGYWAPGASHPAPLQPESRSSSQSSGFVSGPPSLHGPPSLISPCYGPPSLLGPCYPCHHDRASQMSDHQFPSLPSPVPSLIGSGNFSVARRPTLEDSLSDCSEQGSQKLRSPSLNGVRQRAPSQRSQHAPSTSPTPSEPRKTAWSLTVTITPWGVLLTLSVAANIALATIWLSQQG